MHSAEIAHETIEYSTELISKVGNISALLAKGNENKLSTAQKNLVKTAQKVTGEEDTHKALEKFCDERIKGDREAIKTLQNVEQNLKKLAK